MLSWKIFMRAVRVILDDIGAALRVTALPYAILVVASVWFISAYGQHSLTELELTAMGEGDAAPILPDGFLAASLAVVLLQAAISIWIAVAWHRRVLLQESAEGVVPPVHGGQMLGYLGRSILIGLIVAAVSVAILVALAPIVPVLASPAVFIVAVIIFYRLGLILPAGAIGKPITVGEAWTATKGQSATVVLLALLTFAVSLLLQVPALIDASISGPPVATDGTLATPGPISVTYNLVVGWMLLLLGVSILSVLYGHFVERRPLD
ncbi:hypothetical protein [uncultured Jannaschia sp.]|uniref:hypothetical protein n=1 Tax=uncultured Jannaschia sp. TaxID=293347 RepID=UPI002623C1E1|nr:hypothetical protein [uncultured Jannaschia sp.]